jgi:hypothetical protein
MADIIPIKRIWGKQKPPLGTPLNRAHPLAKDLIGAFLINERTGDILYNLVDNKPATLQTIGTGGTADWYPEGFDHGVGGANSKWWSVDPEIFQGLGSTEYTIMWNGYCDTIPSGVYATAFCFDDYDPQWGVGPNGFLHIYDGSTTYTGNTSVENSDVNLAFVRRGAGTTDCDGYINGELDKNDQHPYSLPNPTTVRIGFDNYSSESWYGTMRYLYFWKRALTHEEIKSLNANPYQMFDKVEYIDIGGVAGGVTINATKGNINIAGIDAIISEGITINATKGNINIAGIDAIISEGITINANKGNINIAGIDAIISEGITINANKGNINIAGVNPVIDLGITIVPNKGNINIAGVNPEILAGVVVEANKGNINIAGIDAIISEGITINANKGNINIAGVNPFITVSEIINAYTGSLILTGKKPNIILGVPAPTPLKRILAIGADNRVFSISIENRNMAINSENRTYPIGGLKNG